jgi:hypothetical protein
MQGNIFEDGPMHFLKMHHYHSMLAYKVAINLTNEYYDLRYNTSMESLKRMMHAM